MADSFPLCWPVGFPRAKSRSRARYRASHTPALRGLIKEIKLLGCPDWNVIISTNMPVQRNGLPYVSGRLLPDPGVAVYFRLKERQMVLACDKWDRLEDNIRAIEMTVEAMRGLDRWGCSDILDRAFTGFAALPPPPGQGSQPWWEVLGCDQRDSLPVIETMYRAKTRQCHPDTGGSHDKMADLNRAIAEARSAKGGSK